MRWAAEKSGYKGYKEGEEGIEKMRGGVDKSLADSAMRREAAVKEREELAKQEEEQIKAEKEIAKIARETENTQRDTARERADQADRLLSLEEDRVALIEQIEEAEGKEKEQAELRLELSKKELEIEKEKKTVGEKVAQWAEKIAKQREREQKAGLEYLDRYRPELHELAQSGWWSRRRGRMVWNQNWAQSQASYIEWLEQYAKNQYLQGNTGRRRCYHNGQGRRPRT